MCDSQSAKLQPEMVPTESTDDSSDNEKPPLSPIVGYNFDATGEDEVSTSSSEEDPDTTEFIKTINQRLSVITGKVIDEQPNTPRSEKRKRLRKKLIKSRKKAANADSVKRPKILFEEENYTLNTPEIKEACEEIVSLSENVQTPGSSLKPVEEKQVAVTADEPILKPDLPVRRSFKAPTRRFSPKSASMILPVVEELEADEGLPENFGSPSVSSFLASNEYDHLKPAVFMTASGKPCTVSKSALAAAENLFKSVDATDELIRLKPDPPGFKVSKRVIPISQMSTQKAAALFKEIKVGDGVLPDKLNRSRTSGFQTASGRFVPVSQKALETVRGKSDKSTKENSTAGVGEMTQEVQDCISALLADEEDAFLADFD